MNVPPNACLVIEDSEAGCQAALAGNMHVLGIGENINLPSAEYVIPDLTVLIKYVRLAFIRSRITYIIVSVFLSQAKRYPPLEIKV